MAAPNPSWDTIVTHTAWNYRPTLADNVSNNIPLLAQLRSLGFIEELEGGRTIVEPLMYGRNTGVKSYQYFDQLSTAPQEGFTAAEFYWKHIAGPLAISGQHEWENQGKAQLKKLLTSLMTQLDISMRETLDEMLFSNGTGNGGKDVSGLDLVVENGAAWSTLGGIDASAAANAFWRNQWIDFDATYTTFGTTNGTSVDGLVAMRKLWTSCTRGPNKPSLIITTEDVYNAYESYGEGKHLRINTSADRVDKKMLDLGFDNQKFKTAPMIWAENCPALTMFYLNSQYLKFYVGKGRNFKVTEPRMSKDQEAKVSHMLLYCQLGCSNRARQGRMDDIVLD